MAHNGWLTAGGILSLSAAATHLMVPLGGAGWYRFFGAGEAMARRTEAGYIGPALVTVAIATVLAGFGAYGLSAGGVLPRLPFLRIAVVAITIVYLARGAVLFLPGLLRRPDLSARFLFWSSAIVLAIGLVHAIGIWQGWADLRGVS